MFIQSYMQELKWIRTKEKIAQAKQNIKKLQ